MPFVSGSVLARSIAEFSIFFPALICERGHMKVNNDACAIVTHLRMFMGEGRSQRSIDGRSIRLWAGQPRVKIPVGTRDFLFFINAQCGSGVHPACSSVW
jgi:hypothetical protein